LNKNETEKQKSDGKQAVQSGESKGIQLEAPLRKSLERAIEYIDSVEFVEATPKSLRLRKRILDATARNERHQTQPSCY